MYVYKLHFSTGKIKLKNECVRRRQNLKEEKND
jgi:hypothetical protein